MVAMFLDCFVLIKLMIMELVVSNIMFPFMYPTVIIHVLNMLLLQMMGWIQEKLLVHGCIDLPSVLT